MALSHAQLQSYYAGQVSFVWARDANGVRLQFPLNVLRRYVDHNGLRGRFELCVDGHNRLQSIRRI